MKPVHLFLLILMNCLWAVSYAAFKVLAPWLDAGGVATLRFGMAGAVLLMCWPWLPGLSPRGLDLLRSLVLGVIVFVFAPRLQVTGVQLGKATDASVLMALDPLVSSVGAAIFLRERIAPRRWMGFVLGLAGAVLMAEMWRPGFRLPALTANALIVLSFTCEAAYSVMGKPVLERAGIFKVLTLALLAGTFVNLFVDGWRTIPAAAAMPLRPWLVLAYLSLVCTVAGYSLWWAVIRYAEVNVAALTVLIQPVVGAAVAVAWLGESLRWGQLWGSLVIVAGLIIGLPRPSKQNLTLETLNT
ncbi:MAG TPA: DMT family transporter [Candidatus Cybelea sp.]|jgi:drug/metabolite transporter (DMT)-like permease|nr:DMT family transporter [Candidatus Cybelea sp.]